jgi:F-type H+-transporting ATPase subunit b
MMQLFIFLTLEEIGRGGLFDFGATLPLLIIQFAILTFVLNVILYNPILNVLNERNEYLVSTLTQASDLLNEANLITEKYELDLQNKRKQIQADLATSEKIYKQVWELELQMIQKECDAYVTKYNKYLVTEKENAFKVLETKIDSLGVQILGKLFGDQL